MTKLRGLRVFAPASVANMACGYDLLGFALNEPGDEIVVKENDSFSGLKIMSIHGDPLKKLPYEVHKNTAGVGAQMLLDEIGYEGPGIEMHIYKKMKIGTGLGSSSASAVGGVMAVNELLRRPFVKRDLLRFAIEGERIADGAVHGDNVAPCLMGGMVFVKDAHQAEAHRIFIPDGLHAVIIHPHVEILTKDSRALLSPDVKLEDHVAQSANLAGMILGFSRNDLDLVQRSMKDIIIEPQRAHLIPQFYEVKKVAEENEALGCSISGAGPSIFALFANSIKAEKAAVKMAEVYKNAGLEYDQYISAINMTGARVI